MTARPAFKLIVVSSRIKRIAINIYSLAKTACEITSM